MRIFTSILGKYSLISVTIFLLLTSLFTATYYLTKEIRGDARRINLAGRQRMHFFHLANHAHFLLNNDAIETVNLSVHLAELDQGITAYEQVLHGLKFGCPACGLDMPRRSTAHDAFGKQLDGLIFLWNEEQKPYLLQIMADPTQARKEGRKLCLGCHDAFVNHFKEVDEFVFALTLHNEQVVKNFNLLRLGILAVSAFAAILIAFFVKQQMIRPVKELHDATVKLEQGDFSCRVVPRTNDEIGTLSLAFNRMSTTLAQNFNEKEELVQQRTAKLRAANEELKAFAYTVSHDLRAPLRAIQGFSAAIREDGQGLDSRISAHVANITAAADHMDNLIGAILSYSQISFKDIHLESVDTERLIAEVVAKMVGEKQHDDAQVTIEGVLPKVMANHGILAQITMNLLSNAVKFVKTGVQPNIRIWAEKKGGTIRLLINDNGIGVAIEDQKRIFDVFVRLHGMDSYPGTGIGLASVRRGVERMGGSCGVESIPGQGSTFWLDLPVVPESLHHRAA
ncbi:MAG: ATP-binding protein [Desulfobulbaceae bacterium]|nr:ATP-binding protein [Desulfobulbaceae bacterium]